jgi:hypothetical protein
MYSVSPPGIDHPPDATKLGGLAGQLPQVQRNAVIGLVGDMNSMLGDWHGVPGVQAGLILPP